MLNIRTIIEVCQQTRFINHMILSCKRFSYVRSNGNTIHIQCNNDLTSRGLNNDRFKCSKEFSTTSALTKEKRNKDGKKKAALKLDSAELNELAELVDMDKMKSQLEQAIETLRNHFVQHVSLRSSIGAIEQLQINFDGSQHTIQDLAQVQRKPKLLVLNVCFPEVIPEIMNVLSKSQMNLNPKQDGTTIYIQIPMVTKQHRENLSKTAKMLFNKCHDHIRTIRNNHVEKLKNLEHEPKDRIHRVEGHIDVYSKQYLSQAESILEAKQKELMGN